jgi:hypothetical protein
MKLPEWARKAFEEFRPQPLEAPDPEALNQWNGIFERFRQRWTELEVEHWNVPEQDERYRSMRAHYEFDPKEYVKQSILECAIESAWELGTGNSPQKVIEAVKELDRLNDQIADAASELAALFRQREEVKKTYSIHDQRHGFSTLEPDAMRLLDAFELAVKRPHYKHWYSVARPEIEGLLRAASSQSRPVPNWIAVLEEVAARTPRIVSGRDAGDIAAIGSKSKKSEWSPWILRLIGMLEDRRLPGLPDHFLLQCLTNQQLADLARVALGAPDDASINGDQIRKLKAAHQRRSKDKDD